MNDNTRDTTRWIPIAQAAAILGSTPLNVLMHVKRGLLAGEEVDGGWLIDPETVAVLRSRRSDGELPSVCHSTCNRKSSRCASCA